jgi:thiamine-phosphate pyrophosphorylase
MMDGSEATRLFLITPPDADPETFPETLREALSAGDVAAVLIAVEGGARAAEVMAEKLVPIIQAAGAAALIADDTRLAGRVKADGVQVGGRLDDLRRAVESLRPKCIVGAANLHSRHAAMQAAELGVDYVFFGRPHGDTHDAPHPKALELAEWWSDLMEVPAVLMAGRAIDSVAEAARTGAAFVALNQAVWMHAGGPTEAIRLALAAVAPPGRRVA